MMLSRFVASLAFIVALASCTATRTARPVDVSAAAPSRLKLASWNLEFLAEQDGAGCEPRTAADYAAIRQIADGLNADVIAFQEAENEAAAARVFDPAGYIIVMEHRPGAASEAAVAGTRSSSLSGRLSDSLFGGRSRSIATPTLPA